MILRQESELTTVGYAYGQPEAALALARLEAYGIRTFAHSWHTLALSWQWTHALGGIELRVPAAQAEDAAAILASLEMSRRPRKRWLFLLFSLVVLALVNFPPPPSGFFPATLRPAGVRAGDRS